MRRTNISGSLCFVALFLAVNLEVHAQSWTVTGSMGNQRAFFTATTLNNGQVLAAGGRNRILFGLPSAELYNPSTGTWSLTGSLVNRRAQHTATLLNNGKVLIAGGEFATWMVSGTVYTCLASAELYDPSAGTFSATGSMSAQRCGGFASFTATLLQNGKVLVAGGGPATGELYDPSTGTFSLTGAMVTPRSGHTATLLPNGEVLLSGGFNNSGNYLATAELYNPATGTFTLTGSMKTSRANFTADLLSTGQVLAAAGQNSNAVPPFLTSAELYSPATGKWTSTGNLNVGRYFQTATLLNSGEVLIAGGGAHLASAELYNPASGTFSLTGSLNTGRTDHSAVLLTNGEAMAVGGYDGSGGNIGYLSSAELFH
jgi:WD40 repeat protein